MTQETLAEAARQIGSNPAEALRIARAIAVADPENLAPVRIMAAAHWRLGEVKKAEALEQATIGRSLARPRMAEAKAALAEGRAGVAERLVREQLAEDGSDPAAMRLLADVATRARRFEDAEKLLRRALVITPSFREARQELAVLLFKQDRAEDAIAVVDEWLRYDPASLFMRQFKATFLGRAGRFEEALAISAAVLDEQPDEPRLLLQHASYLSPLGRIDEAVAALRRAIALQPALGDAWWGLADLKTLRFTAEDAAAMEAALGDAADDRSRVLLHLALGKAHEDVGDTEAAFRHLLAGNQLRRAGLRYDPDRLTRSVNESARVLTGDFFAQRRDRGSSVEGPIFIVGMHRAGSTLVEQILSSHPDIEGTAELPVLKGLSERLGSGDPDPRRYLSALAGLDAGKARAIGEEYIVRAGRHRQTDRRFFIDKTPGNWRHVALIQLALPNARIIDVRRHPLDCCLSNFRQFFPNGQDYSYDLAELGRTYADYVRMMSHFDAVLPDRVHRVIYERLVADLEGEARALLDHVGLPFDPACLRFFETERAVRTPSAQQVRRPINANGIDRWAAYDPWLGPLRDALGPVLTAYPDPPPSAW